LGLLGGWRKDAEGQDGAHGRIDRGRARNATGRLIGLQARSSWCDPSLHPCR
jgi:hypothetical protein